MSEGERHDEEGLLARAVRDAAPSVAASPAARARVFAAAQAEWRAGLAVDAPRDGAAGDRAARPPADPQLQLHEDGDARRRRAAPAPRRWPLALAASLAVLALGAGIAWRARQAAPGIAIAELVRGPVQLVHPTVFGAQVASLAAGAAVAAHDSLQSDAAGGALLRLGPGLTLRLGARSRVELESERRIALVAGTVYVDADPARGRQPLEVATRWGVVSHLGTQYAVGADDARLELAVREGKVQLARAGGAPLQARAGELLRVEASGTVRREALARDDPRWQWLAALPAAFDTDGATLAAFLAWYARETGHELVYAEDADAARAAGVTIGGSIAGLAPEEALDVVAAASGLEVRRDGARVVLDLP